MGEQMPLQLVVRNPGQPFQRCLPVRKVEDLCDLVPDFSAARSGHFIIVLCLVQFIFQKKQTAQIMP
jgi:hypothetical protein